MSTIASTSTAASTTTQTSSAVKKGKSQVSFAPGRVRNNLCTYLPAGPVRCLSSNAYKAFAHTATHMIQELAAAANKSKKNGKNNTISPSTLVKMKQDNYDVALCLGANTLIPNAPMREYIPSHVLLAPTRRRNHKKKKTSPTEAAESTSEAKAEVKNSASQKSSKSKKGTKKDGKKSASKKSSSKASTKKSVSKKSAAK